MVTGLLAQFGNAPPAPLSSEAAATEFSAERAKTTLQFLLGEQQRPHPIGSAGNAAVRDRLIKSLADLGLSAELQRTIGCAADAPICGNVENVIAVIEADNTTDQGAAAADVLLIMAHYDSVPPSPGAGDDGAGVAAILETVRAWQAQETSASNSIALLFTDGEEPGLLGAEAFFAEHPLRTRVHAVINLEGAGSGGGPVNLLRSANRAGFLIDAYRHGASYPAAMSMVQEVFSRMPNDTDFSVANRAGVPSLDFAFGSEFNHYHSRLDTIDNLHLGTLQHHGENLLPLLEQLHSADLRLRKPAYVYQSIGPVWLHWSATASVPIALCALLFLLVGAWRAGAGAGAIALGTARALLAFLASGLVCAGLMRLAGFWLGGIASFPDTLLPWWLLMLGGVACTMLLVAALSLRNKSINRESTNHPQSTDFWPAYLGVWLLLGLFALTLAWTAPLAANLLIIPTLLVGLITLAVLWLRPAPKYRTQTALVVVSCVALGTLFLGLAPAMQDSQGLNLAPATYLMLAIATLPLLATAPSKWWAAGMGAVAVAGLIWSVVTPMYSPTSPQFVSIHYQQNVDTKEANWIAYAPNPLPQRLLDVAPYTRAAALRFPWESTPTALSRTKAPWIEISRGNLRSSVDEQGLVLNYEGDASVEHATFVLPRAGLELLTVNGKPVSFRRSVHSDYLLFRFYAPLETTLATPSPEGTKASVEVVIKKQSSGTAGAPTEPHPPFYLIEGRSGLPPAAISQLEARGATAMPHHQGDQWLTFRRIVTP